MAQKNPITDREISIIKLLLQEGWENQQILSMINSRRGKPINSGRISEIKNNKKDKYKNIPIATKQEFESFKNHKINSPTSTNQLKNILYTVDYKFLKNKESQNIEYKEEFTKDILKKTYKTICGLANTRGGYIIFGVKNDNREIIGLSENQFSKFNEEDNANYEFEKYFNQQIIFKPREYNIRGKKLGILYIYKSDNKPVMFKKDLKVNRVTLYKEGEIYYRGNGKTELIKSAELEKIIQEKVDKKVEKVLSENFRNSLEKITETILKKYNLN